MTRATALLLSSLVTISVAARTADIRVTLAVSPSPVRIGETLIAVATVENRGPNEAHDTRFSLGILPDGVCYAAARLGTLKAGAKRTFTCSAVIDVAWEDEVEVFAVAQSFATPEPSEAHRKDNSIEIFTPVYRARLEIAVEPYRPAAVPGVPMPLRISYRNISRLDATNTVITLGSKSPWVKLPSFCTVDGSDATCPIGTLAPSETAEGFEVEVLAFDQGDVSFLVTSQIDADDGVHASDLGDFRTYRTQYVTHTRDDGSPGSLRSAFFLAGATCRSVPCLIAFRIPTPPGTASHTIRLEKPLERVRGIDLEIDGRTQAMYVGDTNPGGPEIVIDGSALASGDGLHIPSRCGIAARGLAVHGFPGSAFLLDDRDVCFSRAGTVVEQNVIGTPTLPNQRGIFASTEHGWTARGNVISGNTRSAIFAERGAGVIARNVLTANGASGIYIGADASGTRIDDNSISFNAHWGVAIDREAFDVTLRGNTFHANGALAIDRGLDGPDAGLPRIRSARYENGETIIELEPAFDDSSATIYAADAPDPSGYGEGQRILGEVRPPDWRLTVPADLRGQWITATLTTPSSTSEFGPALETQ